MFWHNFVYSLKTLFKSKSLIFWTFVFPILLGTFFKLAFSNIEKNEVLEVFNIAVVNNEEFKKDEFFNEALKSLSTGENRIFNVSYLDQKKSEKLLDECWNESLKIVEEKWDYVTVQQGSAYSGVYETFEPYLTEIINFIKKTSPPSKIVFHRTWAYENGSDHGDFPRYLCDSDIMLENIIEVFL